MSSIRQLLDEFSKQQNVDVSTWSVVETESLVLISRIPNRDHAGDLLAFLTGQGMICTLSMGDKRGTVWSLAVRAPMTGPPEEAD